MKRLLFGIVALLLLVTMNIVMAQDKGLTNKTGSKTAEKLAPGSGTDQFLQDYDRNKDGFLQRDELPSSWREHFAHIDTNKDGKLSREELDRGAVYLQPRRRPSDLMHILIEMTDCDEDCACEIQQVYDGLRKLDKNNDGKIDPNELKAGRHDIVEQRINGIFKDLDENNDGKISKAEARGLIRRNFERLDVNKDGFISRDELHKGASEKIPGTKPNEAAAAPKQN